MKTNAILERFRKDYPLPLTFRTLKEVNFTPQASSRESTRSTIYKTKEMFRVEAPTPLSKIIS